MTNGKRPDDRRFDKQRRNQQERGRQENDPIAELEELLRGIHNFSKVTPEKYAIPGAFADRIAESETKMTTTQLRKFFTKVKNLERQKRKKDLEQIKNGLYLMIPELVYATGRDELISVRFSKLIVTIIKEKIETIEDFEQFSQFMTALVAYKKRAELDSKRRGR